MKIRPAGTEVVAAIIPALLRRNPSSAPSIIEGTTGLRHPSFVPPTLYLPAGPGAHIPSPAGRRAAHRRSEAGRVDPNGSTKTTAPTLASTLRPDGHGASASTRHHVQKRPFLRHSRGLRRNQPYSCP